jgi:hypothetical protein
MAVDQHLCARPQRDEPGQRQEGEKQQDGGWNGIKRRRRENWGKRWQHRGGLWSGLGRDRRNGS